MSLNNQFRSSGLETYATLNADDGVTHVGITSNSVRSTDLLYFLDGLDPVVKVLAIHANNFAFLELNLQ